MHTLDNLGIVIRSAGERTAKTVEKTARRLFPTSKIAVVCERPFLKAVIKCYETAIAQQTLFTLALDADLLLAENAPELIYTAMNNFNLESEIRIHFRVYDKFIGERDAGNHLYHTEKLIGALKYFKANAKENVFRPESQNLRLYAEENGFNSERIIEKFLGYHAFRQYYANIYQSMYNLAVKKKNRHSKVDSLTNIKNLQKLSEEMLHDADYIIAYEGFLAGHGKKTVILDYEKYFDITEILDKYNLKEKLTISL